jgi:hypothetical protein
MAFNKHNTTCKQNQAHKPHLYINRYSKSLQKIQQCLIIKSLKTRNKRPILQHYKGYI